MTTRQRVLVALLSVISLYLFFSPPVRAQCTVIPDGAAYLNDLGSGCDAYGFTDSNPETFFCSSASPDSAPIDWEQNFTVSPLVYAATFVAYVGGDQSDSWTMNLGDNEDGAGSDYELLATFSGPVSHGQVVNLEFFPTNVHWAYFSWTAGVDPVGGTDLVFYGADCDNDDFWTTKAEEGDDCNDSDASIHPDAEELCDGIDNNCNGQMDEGVQTAYYFDGDQDGYGAMGSTPILACTQPGNYVSNDLDCVDSNNSINPGATETCDGVDQDCNGVIDDGASYAEPHYFADGDGDGYGNLGSPSYACTAPGGYVGNSTDCNDGNNTIHPDALELCDGLDNDCDSIVPADEIDNDRDGFIECDGSDCNDTDPTIYVGATESCDGIDNNCDGRVDEVWPDNNHNGTPDCQETDADGDDWTVEAGDCNDADVNTYPSATELCDGRDNNCDGSVPANELDGDGDGRVTCEGDCDDTDADIYTGAVEVCDDKDNDCDGDTDEGVCATPTPTPPDDTPTPVDHSPTPGPDSPTPDVESPTPSVESPTPDGQTPTPDVTSTPVDESPTPDVDSPTPVEGSPTPDVESPTPGDVSPTPGNESPSPDPSPADIPTIEIDGASTGGCECNTPSTNTSAPLGSVALFVGVLLTLRRRRVPLIAGLLIGFFLAGSALFAAEPTPSTATPPTGFGWVLAENNNVHSLGFLPGNACKGVPATKYKVDGRVLFQVPFGTWSVGIMLDGHDTLQPERCQVIELTPKAAQWTARLSSLSAWGVYPGIRAETPLPAPVVLTAAGERVEVSTLPPPQLETRLDLAQSLAQARSHLKHRRFRDAAETLRIVIQGTREGHQSHEAHLLLAQVCFKQFDIGCAIAEAEQARELARTAAERDQAQGMLEFLQRNFGKVEFRAAVDAPVEGLLVLESLDPIFDKDVKRYFKERVAPLATQRRTLPWIMYLPATTYRLYGQKFAVEGGKEVTVMVTFPPSEGVAPVVEPSTTPASRPPTRSWTDPELAKNAWFTLAAFGGWTFPQYGQWERLGMAPQAMLVFQADSPWRDFEKPEKLNGLHAALSLQLGGQYDKLGDQLRFFPEVQIAFTPLGWRWYMLHNRLSIAFMMGPSVGYTPHTTRCEVRAGDDDTQTANCAHDLETGFVTTYGSRFVGWSTSLEFIVGLGWPHELRFMLMVNPRTGDLYNQQLDVVIDDGQHLSVNANGGGGPARWSLMVGYTFW